MSGYDKVIDNDVDDDSGDVGSSTTKPNSQQTRTSLQFQNFHSNETLEEGRQPQTSSSGFFGSSSTGTGSSLANKKFLWSIEYYQQFFNVDSESMKTRTLSALYPMKNFFETVDGRPDLYATVWFSTTVITVLYFSSTVAGYLAAHSTGEPYNYQFSTLTIAASLIYGYTFLMPFLCWGILRWYQCEPSLLEILCLYGYSNAAWVPVSLVSISPLEFLNYTKTSNWLRWIAVILGFSLSVFFLLRNLLPVVNRADAKTSQLMTIGVALLHLGFALAIKFLFFSYVSVKAD